MQYLTKQHLRLPDAISLFLPDVLSLSGLRCPSGSEPKAKHSTSLQPDSTMINYNQCCV